MPPRIPTTAWASTNIVIPDETESPGPFDLDVVPHTAGVFEAWDDPMIRQILLPWAARCAKTTTAVICMMQAADVAPRPALFVNATEQASTDAVQSTIYPLLENSPAHAPHLLPPMFRNKRSIQLERCRIRVGNAGAPTTLRGFPACYGHASEVSVWPRKKSADANTLRLFGKRFKLFPFDSKQIFESSPTKRGQCNITDLVTARGVQIRSRYVPCPHCGTYQLLVFGGRDAEAPGVKWDKDPATKHSDPTLAEETAWYRCVKGCRIEDADRGEMLRAGVWLAEGQTITPRRNGKPGTIGGKPRVESSTVAFGTSRPVPGAGTGALSALYSPLISGWGQIAREWLEALDDPTGEAVRDFICSTLGLEYDPAPVVVQPHELAERLGTPDRQKVCPEWTRFLTLSSDVGQIGEELIFYWWVAAWGVGERGGLVDWGLSVGEAAFLEAYGSAMIYTHADGGAHLRPVRVGIDSGAATNRIYQLCAGKPGWWPIKGSNNSAFLDVYSLGFQRSDVPPELLKAKRDAGLGDLFLVNTQRTQEWIEALVTGVVKPGARGWFTLPVEGQDDPDLLDQLLADYRKDERTEHGRYICSWPSRGPNEYRDAARYGWALAWHYTRHGQLWDRLPARGAAAAAARTQPKRQGLTTPDGRPFLITER